MDLRFWGQIGQHFDRLVIDLPGNRTNAVTQWREVLSQTARETFDQTWQSMDHSGRTTQAFGQVAGTLRTHLRHLDREDAWAAYAKPNVDDDDDDEEGAPQ